jgi:hypothetical protein
LKPGFGQRGLPVFEETWSCEAKHVDLKAERKQAQKGEKPYKYQCFVFFFCYCSFVGRDYFGNQMDARPNRVVAKHGIFESFDAISAYQRRPRYTERIFRDRIQ